MTFSHPPFLFAPPRQPTTQRVIDSPVGPLTLMGDDAHLTHLLYDHQVAATSNAGDEPARDDTAFGEVVDQLNAYFAGELTDFNVALAPSGTEFQLAVWQALTQIPFGETASYGELASAIGRPSAARAVGAANGQNPISIIVPCHRVIGASGNLTGYGGGLDRKALLLGIERDHTAPRLAV